ncbi:MAG: hypothetical protein QOG31_764 [Thermoplasmata archaeon]|jgi:DNA-binding NarL/FixJ family response regulator|nr:hypothetical protein [Thermoplasmata archaeon]
MGACAMGGWMTGSPVRILLWTEEACQAAYLETVLEMEAPGLAEVTRCEAVPLPADQAACDLVLLAVAGDAPTGPEAAWSLPIDPLGAPVIVVSPWLPGFTEVHQLMRLGAEDVLGLAELSPRRLVAAIVKAVERHARHAARASPDAPRRTAHPARLPFAAEADRLAQEAPPVHPLAQVLAGGFAEADAAAQVC